MTDHLTKYSPGTDLEKKDKKILWISYHFPPSASSGVLRSNRFLKHLPGLGWHPHVLTIFPEFYGDAVPLDPKLKAGAGLEKQVVTHSRNIFDPDSFIKFIKKILFSAEKTDPGARFPDKIPQENYPRLEKKGVWKKIKDLITVLLMVPDKQNGWFPDAVLKGASIIKKEQIDCIYATGGPWTALLIGTVLKKLSGLPLILDFRDPWMDNPYEHLGHPLRLGINTFLEKWCIDQADFVIANTEHLRRLFLKKYSSVSPAKFITITNGYDPDDFLLLPEIKKAATGHSNKLIITHIGAIYGRRGSGQFLKAVSQLLDSGEIPGTELEINFVGRVERALMDEMLTQFNLNQIVKFTGQLSRKEALVRMVEADILLLIQPATALQIPAKLFEYIKTGNPVFAICEDGATRAIIVENGLGIVSENSIEDIKHKLLYFYRLYKTNKLGVEPVKKTGSDCFDSLHLTEKLARVFEQVFTGRKNL
jgi:glycosyltransferase involved in cell wall biosynthesis